VACALGLYAAAWLVPLPERLERRDSALLLYAGGEPMHAFLSEDDRWRIGRPAAEVDPAYVRALVALEDQRFWTHWGVDPVAVGRAALSNLTNGRVVSGASTITMQLVRVLEPRPRTLSSKVLEALRAAQLEVRMDKDAILTEYLRFIPFGRNVEGVDAAALTYFGHRADHLTPAEVAVLLAVPQAPNARYPSARNVARLRAGRDSVARDLERAGALPAAPGQTPAQALAEILAAPVPSALEPLPREAPHAASWLRADATALGAPLRTTIERGAQLGAERLVRARRAELARAGVHNASVVVVDHATGAVRALVGNLDWSDADHSGQMIAFDTPRSTGSLLKPAILALAMEEGLAHPAAMVPDVPAPRAGWNPRNYDGDYNGLVSLGEALTRSLNVPFVDLAERLGPSDVLDALRSSHFEHLVSRPGHYGLGLAIGGVEATALEIAGLYTAFSSGGVVRRPRVLADAPPEEGARLMSPAAAYLVREELRRERPDAPYRARTRHGARGSIYWKTGTSNGHHDAWSAGGSNDLTAVVWLGNLSRDSSEALVGARVAAPLMFDVLEALSHARAPAPPRPEADLKPLEVCQDTGHACGLCEKTRSVDVPVHAVPVDTCRYHVEVEVEVASGLAVRPSCRQGRATRQQVAMRFPSRVRRWLDARRFAVSPEPEWAPGCAPPEAARPPRIEAPPPSRQVLLIPGVPADRQRVMLRASSPASGALSWFVDGAHVGDTRPGEDAWWVPVVGTHEVTVVDSGGRSASREVVVARPGR
jgi:penicillin-binding protein 1C